MNKIIIQYGCFLDKKLYNLWYGHNALQSRSWIDFISTLDDNIINVENKSDEYTILTFKNESDKTWFLLRWS